MYLYFFLDMIIDLVHDGKPIILVLHLVPLGETCVEGASCHCSMEFCETGYFAAMLFQTCGDEAV